MYILNVAHKWPAKRWIEPECVHVKIPLGLWWQLTWELPRYMTLLTWCSLKGIHRLGCHKIPSPLLSGNRSLKMCCTVKAGTVFRRYAFKAANVEPLNPQRWLSYRSCWTPQRQAGKTSGELRADSQSRLPTSRLRGSTQGVREPGLDVRGGEGAPKINLTSHLSGAQVQILTD